MKPTKQYIHHQRNGVYIALILFEMILVLLQLWLFTASLEGILSHEPSMAIPASIVSFICLAANSWMLMGVEKTDHEA